MAEAAKNAERPIPIVPRNFPVQTVAREIGADVTVWKRRSSISPLSDTQAKYINAMFRRMVNA